MLVTYIYIYIFHYDKGQFIDSRNTEHKISTTLKQQSRPLLFELIDSCFDRAFYVSIT